MGIQKPSKEARKGANRHECCHCGKSIFYLRAHLRLAHRIDTDGLTDKQVMDEYD